MSRLTNVFAFLSIVVLFAATGEAQTAGLGLRPMRAELEVFPGKEKTTSFTIEAPPADVDVRGRLILTLTDWVIHPDTSVTYHDAGTLPNSASSWITYTPSDVTIASGQQRLVRVTARVPVDTTPGVYTSAIFVQERPPANTPAKGEQILYFRFRYVMTLYVVVPPVTREGELVNVGVISDAKGSRMISELKNAGTQHLRPSVSWFLRSHDKELVSAKGVEATVLLPFKETFETMALPKLLSDGNYEMEVLVDFHDGRPIQSMKRSVLIKSPVDP